MPIGFVRFCFGFFPNPVHPVCPASTFWLYFPFSPCPLGFEGPTMFLNLDLIYSTNVWEKRELDFLFVWDVLQMIIIYANSTLPSPSSKFPPKKVPQWVSCWKQRSRVGLQSPWGCNVKGRTLKFMSYLCCVNKMGVVGFKKFCF